VGFLYIQLFLKMINSKQVKSELVHIFKAGFPSTLANWIFRLLDSFHATQNEYNYLS